MSKPRKALITGITGQDGSYLAELLLDKGYEVHGLIRRSSQFNTQRIDHLYVDPHEAETRFFLHYADLTDSSSLIGHLHRIKPAEVYNLGAQSHVKVSFEMPEFTAETAAMGTLRMLEAVRTADWPIRFYQAGSSEMYGKVLESPAARDDAIQPAQPLRDIQGLRPLHDRGLPRGVRPPRVSNGILFNHESPRRGGTFVTRKVTRGVAAILKGEQEHLFLGNLDARRDWGYAKEYVEAMWLMLQQPDPGDYVVATGETHSVRELCETAFGLVGLDWEQYVRVDVELLPTDGSRGALRRRLQGEAGPRLGGANEVPRPGPPDAGARPGGSGDGSGEVPRSHVTSLKGLVWASAQATGIDLVRLRSLRHPVGRRAQLMRSLGIDIVIDVGANEGQFGIELRRAAYAGGIVSIEPLSGPFKKLSRLAAEDRQWTTIRSAVGPRAGSTTIHVAANGGASSSILPMLDLHAHAAPEAYYISEEKVEIATLDALVQPRLLREARVFTKLDVQGYELQVLAGGAATLTQSSLVQLEMSLLPLYETAPTYWEILEFMAHHGFRLVGIEPGLAAPTGLLLQVDGLFVSEDAMRSLEGIDR